MFTKNQRTTRVLPHRRQSLLRPPTHTSSTEQAIQICPSPRPLLPSQLATQTRTQTPNQTDFLGSFMKTCL